MNQLQSSGWLDELYNDSPVAIAIYKGEHYTITFANPAMCEIWDRPARDVVGKPLFEALPEVKGQGYEGILDHVYRTGQPYTGHESPAPVKRGEQIETCYFNLHYKIIHGKSDTEKGIIQTAIDVTDLVTARQRVEAEKDLLKFALHRARIGTWRYNLLTHHFERSEQFDLIAGLKNLPVVSSLETFTQLICDGDRLVFDHHFEDGLKSGAFACDIRLRKPDSAIIWIQVKGETAYNLTGFPLAMSGVIIDITEQKNTLDRERMLAVETAAHKESERQRGLLNGLFLELPAMIALLKSSEHRFEFVNPAYQRMFGSRKFLGLTVLEALTELKDQGITELLDNVYRTGEPFVGREVNLMVAKDEYEAIESVYIDFLYKATYDEKGNIDGIFVFAYDVSEQVKARKIVEVNHKALVGAQAELFKKNEHLIKVNADLDSFVYTASHDLKAPISNLEGLLSAFLQENKMFQQNELIKMMFQSIERFKKTIVDLTDITKTYRIDHDDFANISLTEIISEVTLDMRQLLEKRPFQIVCKIETDIIPYSRKNLRSIIYNLFSNALKYASLKRDPVVIFESTQANGYNIISVQDNGLGLSEANLKNLFIMFKRVHQHIEGTGIGLYIIKRIIENSEGRIEVKSQEDVGTTFTVYLKQPGKLAS